MTAPRDADRMIRAYLEPGPTELPDRSFDEVRGTIERTHHRAGLGPWRNSMPGIARLLALGAAAVAVIALVSVNLVPSLGVGEQSPSPRPSTSQPTTTPSFEASTSPGPSEDAVPALGPEAVTGPLGPGRHTYLAVDDTLINVSFLVPEGWAWNGWYLYPQSTAPTEGVAISFWAGGLQVYDEPCQWQGALPEPPTGPTAADLMDALEAQPLRAVTSRSIRFADAAEKVERWIGYQIDISVPEDVDFSSCDNGEFRSWGPDAMSRFHQGPGQRDSVWAIDLALNERLVIDASSFPDTPERILQEQQDILDSIVTGHWG